MAIMGKQGMRMSRAKSVGTPGDIGVFKVPFNRKLSMRRDTNFDKSDERKNLGTIASRIGGNTTGNQVTLRS
jgi:hypothetical protein